MVVPKVGLRYIPPQLVWISRRHKYKQSLVQYIIVEETNKVMRRMLRIGQSLMCLTYYNLPLHKAILQSSTEWEMVKFYTPLFFRG